ncbi:hypothetical protein HHK36_016792 [Tetracentron sinense]|uniref:BACK domain-containing protein n=1 Tax=Tetracentron sinense TaxID=13715 RepID=A0A834Z6I2_TETSI|nr:hypothetical protein HHK36_016792 [Tetracentron sinense]
MLARRHVQGALFFGVEALLLKCKTWFSKVALIRGLHSLQIPLDAMIEIWNFGLEHGEYFFDHRSMLETIDFIPELCTGYLARNFVAWEMRRRTNVEVNPGGDTIRDMVKMELGLISDILDADRWQFVIRQMWVISCSSFGDVPHKFLYAIIKHPHLTVDSEKHLCEALLVWLSSGTKLLECLSNLKDDCTDILEQVRVSLLPLWFVAGKRRSCYLSKLADESIGAILNLIRDPSMGLPNILRDDEFHNLRIRLTKYTEKVDISGCPQITSVILLLSVLPCSYTMDSTLRKRIKQSLMELERPNGGEYPISQNLFPTLSFEAVLEVDISKCPGLHLETAIDCFYKSFPSLRTLKASYCLNFKTATLCSLVQKCPLVSEVDLTADISPVMPTQVSIISSSNEEYQNLVGALFKMSNERPLLSNITKLTLEGRSDINDSDLQNISAFSGSLSYLNLKGCISVTDVGISKLICKCVNLHSIVVSDTYFGRNSILALCADFPSLYGCPAVHHDLKYSTSLAVRLQKLHMGGCKCVDISSLIQLMSQAYMLKSLCLRETLLVDDAIYNFSGCSLEMLDVSETKVSKAALVHIIRSNPDLKVFKARGCKNFCHGEKNLEESEFLSLSYSGCSNGEDFYLELSRTCILEEIAFGWGFFPFSLKTLEPAIQSLRAITVGLGGSLGECALVLLPTICPLLESVILHFQVISDSIIKTIVESLRHLQVLSLCYCLGDLSSLSFQFSMPNLRKLRLERVTPWMTNDDLVILTRNCASLIELSLLGCTLLNSDSQQIISCGWPGLISLHLEDCGEVTVNGVSSLFDCKAIEDLSLHHNGHGIQRNFILDAALKMPMLRKVALDLCDASEGGFTSPGVSYKKPVPFCLEV